MGVLVVKNANVGNKPGRTHFLRNTYTINPSKAPVIAPYNTSQFTADIADLLRLDIPHSNATMAIEDGVTVFRAHMCNDNRELLHRLCSYAKYYSNGGVLVMLSI